MSRIVSLLVVVSVGLGSVALWQNGQFSAERKRVGDLAAALNTSEAKAVELEKEVARLQEMNRIFQSESEQLRKKLAIRSERAATGNNGDSQLGNPTASGQGEAGKSEKGNFMQAMAKMYSDPEMRKAMRGQQAMGVRRMYGDLGKELGLTPDETEQVTELLTDRQVALAGKSMEMMTGESRDEAKMAELGKAIDESRDEYNRQIESVLGKERFSKLQTYERTLGERMAVNQLQQQLSSRGVGLEESQRQSLLQTMIEERLNAPSNPWDPSKPDVAAQMRAMKSDETMNRLFEQQKQINHRVLDRARTYLSPDQLNALQVSQEDFLRMQQFGMKMGREMMGK